MNSTENETIFKRRHERLHQEMTALGLEAIILNPSPSLYYLTGMHFHLSERPILAFFTLSKPTAIVLPKLEQLKTKGQPFLLEVFTYEENPSLWADAFRKAAEWAGLQKSRIGLEPRYLRLLEFRILEEVLPTATYETSESALNNLRKTKDAEELSLLRKAVQIAQQALMATLPMIQPGRSERQIASELSLQLFQAGADAQLPFPPIVSSGPNSANPHASPTDRILQKGDLVVIDWGAAYQGYIADITRTFSIGKLEPEFETIAQVVLEANTAGRNACIPRTPASDVDRAARSVIEAAGYGEYFTHRTGHGLGLEAHEEPYLRSDNPEPLMEGMAFTVEPGIYLPERGGVRIEDNMIITTDGSECLTDLPRAVQQLPV